MVMVAGDDGDGGGVGKERGGLVRREEEREDCWIEEKARDRRERREEETGLRENRFSAEGEGPVRATATATQSQSYGPQKRLHALLTLAAVCLDSPTVLSLERFL